MALYLLAYLGGLLGAWLMDVTEARAERHGIHSGVSADLLGRWCLGLLRGQLLHADIRQAAPHEDERGVGLVFHFFVGGGGVALLYPSFAQLLGGAAPVNPLLGGLLFGLATSLLPWMILLPAFGWGWFGRRGPQGTNALLASPLSHLPYGLGVGLLIALVP
jgi:hypothetical protein